MRKFKRDNPHTFYGRADFGTERQQLRVCKVCSKSHGAWACPEFKQMEIQSRWDCAKQNKLCFRCLGDYTWDSFVIVQECVVLMVVKKSITDCFIKFEVFCQVVTVGEWKVKRRKSYRQLINRMTLLMKVVMVTGGVKRSKGSTEGPFK